MYDKFHIVYFNNKIYKAVYKIITPYNLYIYSFINKLLIKSINN
jgi:hypothetical protein